MSTEAKEAKKPKRSRARDVKESTREARQVPGPKPGFKRQKIDDPIEARAEMINGTFALTPKVEAADGKSVKIGTLDTMSQIRTMIAATAHNVVTVIKDAEEIHGQPKADTGRVIAGLDALQAAKNIFCDALILPHAHKDVAE